MKTFIFIFFLIGCGDSFEGSEELEQLSNRCLPYEYIWVTRVEVEYYIPYEPISQDVIQSEVNQTLFRTCFCEEKERKVYFKAGMPEVRKNAIVCEF